MPNLKYKFDATGLSQRLGQYAYAMPTAIKEAINDTVSHGRTIAKVDIAAAMGAKSGAVLKRLHIGKATNAKPNAVLIVAGGQGLNLASWANAKQTTTAKGRFHMGGGVLVTIMGTRLMVQHGFMVSMGKSKTVFLRVGDKVAPAKGKYAGRKILRGPNFGRPLLRQKLQAQKGPTVAETFEKTPGIAVHTNAEIEAWLPKEVESQIDRFTKAPTNG